MDEFATDFLIIGGGILGISIANELKRMNENSNVCIMEKEKRVGMHTSGRNSGILHAGIYYEPNTLKASICTEGARLLKVWIEKRRLPINKCGKLIVCQDERLEDQLLVLKNRAEMNGAIVRLINKKECKEIGGDVRTTCAGALWSPYTANTNAKLVTEEMANESKSMGIKILTDIEAKEIQKDAKGYIVSNMKGVRVKANYIVNCAGLHAEKIAKLEGIGSEYILLPFKGLYWKLRKGINIKVNCNIYPVPDLRMPFLGVHLSPNVNGEEIYVGPTATPAWGRENYYGFKNTERDITINMATILTSMYIQNKNGVRNYGNEQMLLYMKGLLAKEVRKICPLIEKRDLIMSDKVGIRPQLYNTISKKLESDFIYEKTNHSFHILNSISPAFTSCLKLAQYIVQIINE